MSADLAVITADPSVIERAGDPAEFIIQACERAKAWLAEVLEHGDIEQIAEMKSQAEAIRVYTMSRQLGKDAQLSATEIVRRAERGIGVAIRRGQENQEIARRGEHTGNQYTGKVHPDDSSKPSALAYGSKGEMYGSADDKPGILSLADEGSEEDFEEALSEARTERNLARANVVRKMRGRQPARPAPAAEWVPDPSDRSSEAAAQRRKLIRDWAAQGYSSRQMEELLGTSGGTIRRIARETGTEIPADSLIGRTRLHDSNHIVQETVHALAGAAMGVELVDPAELDRAQIGAWTASLTDSIRVLNRLIKTMKEAVQ